MGSKLKMGAKSFVASSDKTHPLSPNVNGFPVAKNECGFPSLWNSVEASMSRHSFTHRGLRIYRNLEPLQPSSPLLQVLGDSGALRSRPAVDPVPLFLPEPQHAAV